MPSPHFYNHDIILLGYYTVGVHTQTGSDNTGKNLDQKFCFLFDIKAILDLLINNNFIVYCLHLILY